MKLLLLLLGLSIAASVLPGRAAFAKTKITPGEPVPLAHLRSLGDVIAGARGGQVHIVYVHGMRAERRGASDAFRRRLEASFGRVGEISRTTKALNLKPWPENARIGRSPIWDSLDDWQKGQPFVDRTVFRTERHNATIIIDEVNWWPLLFPLKCRMLLVPEAILVGADKAHLDLCYRDVAPYHRWISPKEYDDAIARRPALGGAAKGNRYLKQQILDWGLSDAVIATGPMRVYLNATMEAAFDYAAADKATSEYVVISESLGSFVVFDAYADGKAAVSKVLDATHNLYFFANQLALLELARIENLPAAAKHVEPRQPVLNRTSRSAADQAQAGADRSTTDPAQGPTTPAQQSPLSALERWASAPTPAGFLPSPGSVKQIIAFSDPSDALTYRVPTFGSALVANVYVRNAGSFLGLFANPIKAHSGQMENDALWRAMVRETPASTQRQEQKRRGTCG